MHHCVSANECAKKVGIGSPSKGNRNRTCEHWKDESSGVRNQVRTENFRIRLNLWGPPVLRNHPFKSNSDRLIG